MPLILLILPIFRPVRMAVGWALFLVPLFLAVECVRYQ